MFAEPGYVTIVYSTDDVTRAANHIYSVYYERSRYHDFQETLDAFRRIHREMLALSREQSKATPLELVRASVRRPRRAPAVHVTGARTLRAPRRAARSLGTRIRHAMNRKTAAAEEHP